MAIYSRMGSVVVLKRPITTAADVERFEGRKVDAHDEHRLAYGMYVVGRYEDEAEDAEHLFDLGTLKADAGIMEINKAARAVGCDPK